MYHEKTQGSRSGSISGKQGLMTFQVGALVKLIVVTEVQDKAWRVIGGYRLGMGFDRQVIGQRERECIGVCWSL